MLHSHVRILNRLEAHLCLSECHIGRECSCFCHKQDLPGILTLPGCSDRSPVSRYAASRYSHTFHNCLNTYPDTRWPTWILLWWASAHISFQCSGSERLVFQHLSLPVHSRMYKHQLLISFHEAALVVMPAGLYVRQAGIATGR